MLLNQLGHRHKVLASQLLALKMAVDGLPESYMCRFLYDSLSVAYRL
jgi:hypothetical protein